MRVEYVAVTLAMWRRGEAWVKGYHVQHVTSEGVRMVQQAVEDKEQARAIGKAVCAWVVVYPECAVCGKDAYEDYMVHHGVWAQSGLAVGRAHLKCLETRLGRDLTIEDFNLNLPINNALAFGYQLGLRARAGVQ